MLVTGLWGGCTRGVVWYATAMERLWDGHGRVTGWLYGSYGVVMEWLMEWSTGKIAGTLGLDAERKILTIKEVCKACKKVNCAALC